MVDAHNQVRCLLVSEVLRSHGEATIRVTGDSMLPAVQPGDIVTVRRRGISELELGQVVLCVRNGGLMAHRIVGVVRDSAGKRVITRGDALRHNDPPVCEDDILGRVVCVARGSRRLDPRLTLRRRAVSWLLRHSDFSTRVFLRLKRTAWAT